MGKVVGSVLAAAGAIATIWSVIPAFRKRAETRVEDVGRTTLSPMRTPSIFGTWLLQISVREFWLRPGKSDGEVEVFNKATAEQIGEGRFDGGRRVELHLRVTRAGMAEAPARDVFLDLELSADGTSLFGTYRGADKSEVGPVLWRRSLSQ